MPPTSQFAIKRLPGIHIPTRVRCLLLAVTVSIGVSTYLADATLEQELLSQADEAMYVAKRLGRNQVRTAKEAQQMGEDMELMAFLQQEGQDEAAQREEVPLERLRETYTPRDAQRACTL